MKTHREGIPRNFKWVRNLFLNFYGHVDYSAFQMIKSTGTVFNGH